MSEFLDLIWPDHGYGEIRCIANGTVIQDWYDLSDEYGRQDAEEFARYLDDCGWDVYFGVLPRTRHRGTAADTPPETTVLWADVDAKHHDEDKHAALDAVLGYDISPSVIVDSGHGYHCYWKLADPVPFADAAKAMKQIARTMGGDPVYDAARILRLPGLRNHKNGDSVPVRLLAFDALRRYRFSDFYIPPEPKARPMPYRGESRDIPDWLNELLVGGAPVGQRSEAAFKAVLWLLRYGFTPDEIVTVFEAFPQGIGEKAAEKGGARWLRRTIEKAGLVA